MYVAVSPILTRSATVYSMYAVGLSNITIHDHTTSWGEISGIAQHCLLFLKMFSGWLQIMMTKTLRSRHGDRLRNSSQVYQQLNEEVVAAFCA